MLVQVKNHGNRANGWWNSSAKQMNGTKGSVLMRMVIAGRPMPTKPDVTSWSVTQPWGTARTFEALGTIS